MNKIETTPMFKLIMQMSLPAMLSMLIQAMYNIVDSLFVARLGEEALTAVSLAFPVQTLIIAVGVGTGVGLNSLIARSLGEKNTEKASQVADHGIVLGVIGWLFFAVIGLLFSRTFFEGFTDSQEIIEMGTQYTTIVLTFSLGVLIQINMEKIFQGTGKMLFAMTIQIVGAVINIILDPIFIFGLLGVPKMGVAGAAVATVIGQTCAMLLGIYLMVKRTHEIKINIRHFKIDKKIVKQIYQVGFPAIIMQAMTSFVIVLLNNILMGFSGAAVAVLGVYFKVQSFVFMPVFGLTQGTLPIMGYSFGAQNKERLMECFRKMLVVGIGIMVVGTIAFWTVPRQIIQMFNGTEEMIEMGVSALRIISIGFVLAGISIMISTVFQAIGAGMQSLIVSVLRQMVVLVPAAYLLSIAYGIKGVWWAFPLSEIISIVASVWLLGIQYRKRIKTLADGQV